MKAEQERKGNISLVGEVRNESEVNPVRVVVFGSSVVIY